MRSKKNRQVPTFYSQRTVRRFLDHIRESTVPRRVDASYLSEHGFGGARALDVRRVVTIFRFVDAEHRPTALWLAYKELGPTSLIDAVEAIYEDLMGPTPATPSFTTVQLDLWFRPPRTLSSKEGRARSIRSFRTLTGIVLTAQRPQKSDPSPKAPTAQSKPYQLVIQIPPLRSREQYIELFTAIKVVFTDHAEPKG